MNFRLILAAFAFSSASAITHAQTVDVGGVPAIEVFYGDLNLAHPAGAAAVMNRIRAAAARVCGGKPNMLEVRDQVRYRACVSTAVNNALADLNAAAVQQ